MRIALLTHSVNPRGGVVHVLELGRALQQRGHDVTLLVPMAPGQRLFRETPCRVEAVAVPPAAADLAATVRTRIDAFREHLAAVTRRTPFDVLHAHDGIGANALADLAEAGAIGGAWRTVHHVDRHLDARVQAWELRSIRAASRVLCVSRVWRERLRDELGVEAAQVPNGVDLGRYTPHAGAADAALVRELGVGAQRPVVLAVGGVEARKNTRRLLQAFLRLRSRLPRAQLVIAGGASLLNHDGEAAGFRADAQAAGIAIGPGAPIVLTGTVPDRAMPALYRSADVLAMPSLLEGFGLAALEALACGTPAVVSRRAPFSEHFDAADVHWADPLDPASIADALRRAVAAPRRSDVPEVCRRHGWDASARRHEALYRAAA